MNEKELTSQRQTLKDRGICVVIPTYNNEKTAADVARRALEQCDDVYVVCDGCTDSTEDNVKKVPGVKVISYEKNRGKGYALKRGFKQAREDGFAYAITLDADAQHKPEDIHSLLEANKRWPGQLIVGKRDLSNVNRSKGSSFANKFSNFWFWLQTGKRKIDTQSGYRLYPIKKMPADWIVSNRYESELEFMVLPTWHGMGIKSAPIDVYYPAPEERVSHFRPGKDFFRISVLNTVLTLAALVYGWPVTIGRNAWDVIKTVYSITVTFFVGTFIFTPMIVGVFAIGKVTPGKRRWLHHFMWNFAKFSIFTHKLPGGRFSMSNPDPSWADSPKVVICNHQSHFDLLCQLIFTPKIIFLTNTWVWNNVIFGAIVRRAEYIPVKEGVEEMMAKLKDLVSRGYSIAIFPEGSRSPDCSIRRFHQGAFHIAKELNLDILPMCLYGAGKLLPKHKYVIKRSPVRIEVGDVITRAELDAMGSPLKQSLEINRRYKKWYEKLCNKIEQDV